MALEYDQEALIELKNHTRLLEALSVKIAKKSLEDIDKDLEKLRNATKDATKELDGAGRAANSLNKKTGLLDKSIGHLKTAMIGTEEVVRNYERMNRELLGRSKHLVREFGAVGSSIVSGKRGIDVFTGALSSAGTTGTLAITQYARSHKQASAYMLVFSRAISGLASLLGSFVMKGLSDSDRLSKAHMGLAKYGAGAGDALVGLRQDLQSAHLAVSDLEFFGKVITSNSKMLAVFGNTVRDGRRQFSDTVGEIYKSDLGRRLMDIGYGQEEQIEMAAAYLDLQHKSGNLQLRTAQNQAKSVSEWTLELDRAARLTGASTDELIKQQESRMMDERYYAQQQMAVAEGKGKEAKAVNDLVTMLQAAGQEEMAKGVMHAWATGGALITKEAQALGLTTDVMAVLAHQIATGDTEGSLVKLGKGLQEMNTTVGKTQSILGPDGPFLNLRNMNQFILFAKKLEEMREKGEDVNAYLAEQQKLYDEEQKTHVGVIRAQQGIAVKMDSFTSVIGRLLGLFSSLGDKVEWLVDKIPSFGVEAPTPDTRASSTGGGTGARASTTGTTAAGGAIAGASGITPGGSGSQLLDLIGAKEGGTHGYNALVYRREGGRYVSGGAADLSNMTLNEVYAFQDRMPSRGHVGNAVGRYQFQKDTLKETVAALGLDPKTTKFTPEVQDALATKLIQQTREKSKNDVDFADRLAGRWASLKQSSGQGRYDGKWGNVASVSHSDVLGAISASGMRTGGISSGPLEGYTQLLHGTEAVVPLPDGKRIPVDMPDMKSMGAMMREQVSSMREQLGALRELIDQTRRMNDTQEKILRAASN